MIANREIDLDGDEYTLRFGHDTVATPRLRRRGTFRKQLTFSGPLSLAPGPTRAPEGATCEDGVCRRPGAPQDVSESSAPTGKAQDGPDMEAPLILPEEPELELVQPASYYCSCAGWFFNEISWRNFVDEFKSAELRHSAFAEFLAMLMFNFLSCGAVANVSASKAEGEPSPGEEAADLLQIVLIHFMILVVLIYTVAPLSGAHINPIVSVAFTVTGLQSVPKGIAYVIAQTLGGMCGSGLLYLATPWNKPGSEEAIDAMAPNVIPDGRTVWMAFTGEVVASFILLFVIFGVAIDPRGWGKLAPVAVALTVAMLIFVVGSISSMCANPARALGAAVASGYWKHHWVFWTAPFIGAVIAGWIYVNMYLFREEGADDGPSTCPRTNTRVYVDARRQAMLEASGAASAPDLHIKTWIKGPPPDLLNSVLVLEFFGVDCKPCRYTVPHLSALNKKYTKLYDRIVFIGLSPDSEKDVREFVKKYAPDYYVAIDNNGTTAHEYLDMLGVGTIPAAVVVGKSGKIVWHGHPTSGELEDAIKKELNEIGVQLDR